MPQCDACWAPRRIRTSTRMRGPWSMRRTTPAMQRVSPQGKQLAYLGPRFVMRKVALVFVLAVFVPSLVLAWLAVRSLRDQRLALERQQTLLYQQVADGLAKDIVSNIEQQ